MTLERSPEWYVKQYGISVEAATSFAVAWNRCITDWQTDYYYGAYIGMTIMAYCLEAIDMQQKAEIMQEASHLHWLAINSNEDEKEGVE